MQDISSYCCKRSRKKNPLIASNQKGTNQAVSFKIISGKVRRTRHEFDELRLLSLCTVGFAGFLRFNDLSSIKRSDIIFHNIYMKIFIEKSKTDIYRDGAWVVIAKTKRITCPVKIFRRYVNRLNFPPSTEGYIFRALFYFKKKKNTNAGNRTNHSLIPEQGI